jgi:hypothetical protein
MKSFSVFIPLLFTVLLLHSCIKTCEDFPGIATVFDHIGKNEKITYRSGTDTLQFHVKSLKISDPEDRAFLIVMDENCSYDASYQTDTRNDYTISETFSVFKGSLFWTVCVTDDSCFGYDPRFGSPDHETVFLQDTIISGRQITNATLVRRDSLHPDGKIEYVIHHEMSGLIAFKDMETGQLWIKE